MYNVQVDNQIHKIKFDSQFLLRFANTILSQLYQELASQCLFVETL